MEHIIKNDKNLDAVKDNANPPTADNTTKDNTTKENNDKAPEVKTFTQEEVDKIIEKRLAKERKKAEDEKKEAEKLAQMNADEKAKYELEKRIKELEGREAELSKKELQNTSLDILVEKGYSTTTSKELLAFLDYSNADNCKASIDNLDKILKACIETEVNNKIKNNTNVTPKKASGGAKITWEDVMANPKLMGEYRKQNNK